jgi:hypothetical protein
MELGLPFSDDEMARLKADGFFTTTVFRQPAVTITQETIAERLSTDSDAIVRALDTGEFHVLFAHGTHDERIAVEDVAMFQATARKTELPHRVERIPEAEHFFRDERQCAALLDVITRWVEAHCAVGSADSGVHGSRQPSGATASSADKTQFAEGVRTAEAVNK